MKAVKRFLYRHLSLNSYLSVLSSLFFVGYRLGVFRPEYLRFLRRVVRRDDVVIDLGANLGYYSVVLSRLVGSEGKVYAVEPVPPVLRVLERNVGGCRNVEILPFALGERDGEVAMVNDCEEGYMGTGRNRVVNRSEEPKSLRVAGRRVANSQFSILNSQLSFTAPMRRGSEVFGGLERVDFIKCDVEGYELGILGDMAALIERHSPVCLVETCGANRRRVIDLFRSLGYAGWVLQKGNLVSVMEASSEKDIVFLPAQRCV